MQASRRRWLVSRRRWLVAAAALPLAAQAAPARTIKVVQLLDASPLQHELSRDHGAGVQAAIVQHNRSAAGQARPLQLQQIEVAGDAGFEAAIAALRTDDTVALLGTVGESLALRSIARTRAERLGLVHVAPWLGGKQHDADADVVPLLASREAQIQHAMSQLQGVGISELGVVFGTAADQALLGEAVNQMAAHLGLRMRVLGVADGDKLAPQLGAGSPVVLLFLGATLELSRLTQTLAQRKLQRYVISLADIDTATLLQLGTGSAVPLILTQVVPNPMSSPLPVVRDFRQHLKLLFDEAPTALSLAGYLSARYFAQVVAKLDGPPTRAALLQAFGRRPAAELDGFEIRFPAGGRGSRYVTQTLLTADGRLVG